MERSKDDRIKRSDMLSRRTFLGATAAMAIGLTARGYDP